MVNNNLKHISIPSVAKFLGGISLAIIALLLPLCMFPFLSGYFVHAQARYATAESFDRRYSEAALHDQLRSILTYLLPPWDTTLEETFFSPEDVAHMHDVRNIYTGVYVALLGVLILAPIFIVVAGKQHAAPKSAQADRNPVPTQASFANTLGRVVKLCAQLHLFTLVTISLIGLAAVFAWDPLFTLFHRIFFPFNTFWALDPQTSNLIKFLPHQVFQELALVYWISQILIQILFRYLSVRTARS